MSGCFRIRTIISGRSRNKNAGIESIQERLLGRIIIRVFPTGNGVIDHIHLINNCLIDCRKNSCTITDTIATILHTNVICNNIGMWCNTRNCLRFGKRGSNHSASTHCQPQCWQYESHDHQNLPGCIIHKQISRHETITADQFIITNICMDHIVVDL